MDEENNKFDYVVKKIVSCGTQTEWSWFDDFNTIEEHKKENRSNRVKQHEQEKKSKNLSAHNQESKRKSMSREQNKQFSEASSVKDKSNTPLTLSSGEGSRISEKAGNKNTSVKSAKFQEALKTAFEYNSQLDDIFDESESEDDESFYYESDDNESFLPSIGPPQILQYQRESEHSLKSSNPSMENIKQPGQHLEKSLFSGPCQFCRKPILPLPTLKEVANLTTNQLFCCSEYEDFIKIYLSHVDSRENIKDDTIDITPHAPYGTKAARKAAKERAAERMREKELERQKVNTAQVNFFAFTRQVKTIQYQLSSLKCMEEGWTIRPSTPVIKDITEGEINFDIDVNTSFLQKSHQLYEKFYDDGSKFLIIFPDGTGCLYYPSGSVAVLIVSSEYGKYTYIIQKNSDEYDTDDPGILALFEPNGNAACYFKDGNLRLVLTPHSGIQFDKQGNKKKRWQWYFIKGHVHTPPFQPICFTLNKQLSVRLMEQNHIIVTFTCSQRAVRFNVGARLKVLKSAKPPPIAEESDERYLKEMKHAVGNLVNKIQVTLRFPNSPKLEQLTVQSRTSKKLKRHDQMLPKLKEEPSVTVN